MWFRHAFPLVLWALAGVGFASCSSSNGSGLGLNSVGGSTGTGGLVAVDGASSANTATGGMPGLVGPSGAIDASVAGGTPGTGGTSSPIATTETGGKPGTAGAVGSGGATDAGAATTIGAGGSTGIGGSSSTPDASLSGDPNGPRFNTTNACYSSSVSAPGTYWQKWEATNVGGSGTVTITTSVSGNQSMGIAGQPDSRQQVDFLAGHTYQLIFQLPLARVKGSTCSITPCVGTAYGPQVTITLPGFPQTFSVAPYGVGSVASADGAPTTTLLDVTDVPSPNRDAGGNVGACGTLKCGASLQCGNGGNSTGGASGGGGSIGAGTGGSTGGTTSPPTGLDCAAAVTPANSASGGVTDFTDWNNVTGRWGSTSGLYGTTYPYVDSVGSSMRASVDQTSKTLHATGSVLAGGYGGMGLAFYVCATVASFTQVQFSVKGSSPGCEMELQIKTWDQQPPSPSPGGGCDSSVGSCYGYPVAKKVVDLQTPLTPLTPVTIPLADFSGWSAARAAQVLGLQWQFSRSSVDPDASAVGCPIDVSITNVKFLP
jgi:hypothetical protein